VFSMHCDADSTGLFLQHCWHQKSECKRTSLEAAAESLGSTFEKVGLDTPVKSFL